MFFIEKSEEKTKTKITTIPLSQENFCLVLIISYDFFKFSTENTLKRLGYC